MKIASIQFPAFNPYNKSTIEIYFSGCLNNCKNCHNPELHNFEIGEIATLEHINYIIKRKNLFDVVAFLGGEPLNQNDNEFYEVVNCLKSNLQDKEFWLFTGKEIEDVPIWCKSIFDYIKVGRYIEELKQEGFPASKNQRLLKKGKDY